MRRITSLRSRWIAGLGLLWAAISLTAADQAPTAETGFPTIVRLANDLHQVLEPKHRQQIDPTPVLLEQLKLPYLQSKLVAEGPTSRQAVHLSSGMVELLNYLSRAKAFELADTNYFKRAMGALVDTPANGVPALPPISQDITATVEFTNVQVGCFQQMAGGLLALEIAHHALGHYQKYGALLRTQEGLLPINRFLNPEEWKDTATRAANYALRCGLSVDGMKVFLSALEQMPTRPAWVIYFLPPSADIAQTKKQFQKAEKKFFP